MNNKLDKIKKNLKIKNDLLLNMDDINIKGGYKKNERIAPSDVSDIPSPDNNLELDYIKNVENNLPSENDISRKLRLESLKNRQSNMMIADLVSGGAPRILGLIGGAGPIAYNSYAQEGDNYLKQRANDEEIKKANLVSIKNELGSPEYMDAKNAVGMEPYYQPKLSSLNSSSKGMVRGVPKNMYNVKTGGRKALVMDNDGTVYMFGDKSKTPIADFENWEPDQGTGSTSGTDFTGTKTYTQYDKNLPEKTKKGIASYTGLGKAFGDIPEKEAESRINQAIKDKKLIDDQNMSLSELQSSLRIAKESNDPTTFSSNLQKAIRVVEKRLSDQEAQAIMGDQYKSVIERGGQFIGSKLGFIPPRDRQHIVDMIENLIAKERQLLQTRISRSENYAGLGSKGIKSIKGTSGKAQMEKNKEDVNLIKQRIRDSLK